MQEIIVHLDTYFQQIDLNILRLFLYLLERFHHNKKSCQDKIVTLVHFAGRQVKNNEQLYSYLWEHGSLHSILIRGFFEKFSYLD